MCFAIKVNLTKRVHLSIFLKLITVVLTLVLVPVSAKKVDSKVTVLNVQANKYHISTQHQ